MPTEKSPTPIISAADLTDVQNHISPHTIDIDKVGVKNIIPHHGAG